MQDTRNLKRKIIEYSKQIRRLQQLRAPPTALRYWESELARVKAKVQAREENQRKNEKQYRKAN